VDESRKQELLDEVLNQAIKLDDIVYEIRDVLLVKSTISDELIKPAE